MCTSPSVPEAKVRNGDAPIQSFLGADLEAGAILTIEMNNLWQLGPQKGAASEYAPADHRITSVAPLADQPLGDRREIVSEIDQVGTGAA